MVWAVNCEVEAAGVEAGVVVEVAVEVAAVEEIVHSTVVLILEGFMLCPVPPDVITVFITMRWQVRHAS